MSQAAIAQVPYVRPIDEWMRDSTRGFQDRLVCGFDDSEFDTPYSHISGASYTYPQSVRSGSSMAPMQPLPILHQSYTPTASSRPPSLVSCHTHDTITDPSICTNVAGRLPGFPLLEENDGVLEQPLVPSNSPVFECLFWFLDCQYSSRDEEEWKVHCLHHFHGEEPPHSVSCPLCLWKATLEKGSEAWNSKMQHLVNEHFRFGQNLSASRPDFDLFTHLWQKRLISEQDLKELNSGNHNLTRALNNFVTTNGPRSRQERAPGRHKMQHIGQGRPRRT